VCAFKLKKGIVPVIAPYPVGLNSTKIPSIAKAITIVWIPNHPIATTALNSAGMLAP